MLLPETLAVSCSVWPAAMAPVGGVTETEITGFTVMTALDVFVTSAALVAVTVTLCCEDIDAGAVYRPDVDTLPTPVTLQVTC